MLPKKRHHRELLVRNNAGISLHAYLPILETRSRLRRSGLTRRPGSHGRAVRGAHDQPGARALLYNALTARDGWAPIRVAWASSQVAGPSSQNRPDGGKADDAGVLSEGQHQRAGMPAGRREGAQRTTSPAHPVTVSLCGCARLGARTEYDAGTRVGVSGYSSCLPYGACATAWRVLFAKSTASLYGWSRLVARPAWRCLAAVSALPVLA